MAGKNSNPAIKKNLWRKFLKWFIIVLALLLVIAFILVRTIARRGLPDYNATIGIKGLTAEVRVIRDEYGTPHIFAENEADLYRATGYVMAQDRIWQMDLLRRVTLGRLSEIFGDSYVETDLLMRSLRHTEKSKQILQNSPAELVAAVEAFSDGVNQYIAANKNSLPFEFLLLGYKPDAWEPCHSVNLIGFMAWDLKAGWNELLLENIKPLIDSARYSELLPHVERYKSTVFDSKANPLMVHNRILELEKLEKLGLDILCGSNNWAVSGNKSFTGMPLVANDMHLSFSVPGIWMQMHQVVKGKLNVSGLALPGQPLIVVGHNDSIAWGMTNTYVDNLDYYQETINPENINQYWFKGEWHDFVLHNETIKSKSGQVFEKTFRTNHRGPVVSEFKDIHDKVLTIHWVGEEPGNELLSIYKANRATNWNGFTEAFRNFRSVSQNIVYGDINGNIGLRACAGVPVRKRDAIYRILPGDTDEFDWKGMVPYDELPFEFNPRRGYVSSANNRTIDSTYPYHIGVWYDIPYRIDRIRELLEAKAKLSVEDFKDIQNDYTSKYAQTIIDKCFVLLDSTAMSPKEKKVYRLMADWDGSMDKNLVQPSVLEEFIATFTESIFKDELGEEIYPTFRSNKISRFALYNVLENPASPWVDNVTTTETENFALLVGQAYASAIANLTDKFSPKLKKWKWGNIHQITFSHPLSQKKILGILFKLNRGPFAVSGSFHTVSPYGYAAGQPSKVEHGASHRHIFTLHNWDSTLSIIPTGNSGAIKSRFYLDQSEQFVNGEYHYEFFSQSAIEQNARFTMKLEPVN
ncbi:MAG: penicillin acylase family protein [Bacteroidales bacterium]|nr:penicillin acylase family protein [Bacteroidales bacterium]